MAELNVDAFRTVGLIQSNEKMLEMENGCICCDIREDLLDNIKKLADAKKYDYMLIECSGVSEPMPGNICTNCIRKKEEPSKPRRCVQRCLNFQLSRGDEFRS